MAISEDDIVRRALTTEQHSVRRFTYKGLNWLFDEIKSLYPSAVSVAVCNLDQRDTNGSPWLNIHSLRPMKSVITTSTWGNHSSVKIEAVWHDVFAVVDKGTVTVKAARKSIGETV